MTFVIKISFYDYRLLGMGTSTVDFSFCIINITKSNGNKHSLPIAREIDRHICMGDNMLDRIELHLEYIINTICYISVIAGRKY